MKTYFSLRALGVALLLLGCARGPDRLQGTPSAGGDELGNGGDEISRRFTKGRGKALRILDEVRELRAEDIPTASPTTRGMVMAFYLSKRGQLREDVDATSHVWHSQKAERDRSCRNDACGCTGSSRGAPVHLLYSLCRNILTPTAAAVHLIAESVHHLGYRDDSFASLVGVAMDSAWLRVLGGKPEMMSRRAFFDRMRSYTAGVLFRVDLRPEIGPDPRVAAAPSGTLAREALDWRWFHLEREEMARRLRDTSFAWLDELPESDAPYGRCVRPSELDPTVLELSYSGCEVSGVTARLDTVQLLLYGAILARAPGQAAEARDLAARIVNAWSRRGYQETWQWAKVSDPRVRHFRNHHALFDGQEILAWSENPDGTATQLLHYDPLKGTWRSQLAQNSYVPWFSEKLTPELDRQVNRPVFVDGRITAFTECHSRLNRQGAGMVLNPSEGTWRPITRDGAPDRRDATVLAAGNRMLVWGGLACVIYTLPLPMLDGYFYSPKRDRWTPIPPAIALGPRSGVSAVWAKDRLYVWGGCDHLGNHRCYASGFVFTPGKDTWEKMPLEGAPSPRSSAAMVVAGEYLVVAGGLAPDGRVATGGARYHLGRHRWEPMARHPVVDSSDRPFLAPKLVVPIGNLVAFLDEPVAFYDPERDEWNSKQGTFVPADPRNVLWAHGSLFLWSGSGRHLYSLSP